jgi:hypothetical protein
MDNSFKNVIEQSKSVLILLPTKPFFDQVAAGLSLYLSLRDKKDVQVYSPSPMTVEFNRLVGVNRITQDLGNKNLIIRFRDYKATDIERVSYDIENGQFRLTVIPKQKINPPVKDQVELSYSGVSADTVFMIGGANESHFPALTSKDLVGANIVHIGTRDISLSSNKTYVSFAKPASSVSEIVAGLIKENGITLDEDIATNLLMGIEEASNNFTDPAATAETFAIVSELMKSGGRRISQQAPVGASAYPSGAIPGAPARTFQYPQTNLQPLQMQPTRQPVISQTQSEQPIQQTQQQPQQVQLPTTEVNQEKQDEQEPEPPKDWLNTPKIYKGTSVS